MPRKKLCIIGIDPGEMTGIALWSRTDFYAGELEQVDVASYVEGCLKGVDHANVDVFVGIQRFNILPGTHKKTRQPAASEIVGVVQDMGRKYDVPVDVQSASTAARFKNDALRRAGLYTPGKGHANDAARHVLVTLLTFRPDEMVRLLGRDTINVD